MKRVPFYGVHLVIWILGHALGIHQETALLKMCEQVRRTTSCSTKLSFITRNCNQPTFKTSPEPNKGRFQDTTKRTVVPINISVLKPKDETNLKPKNVSVLKIVNETDLEPMNISVLKPKDETNLEPMNVSVLKPRKGTTLKGSNGTQARNGTTMAFKNARTMVTTSNRLSEADGLGKTMDRSVSNNTITSPQTTLFTDKMSWKQAERKCWQENGNLVTIDSQKKQTEVVLLANASGLNEIWIGLYWYAFQWYYSNGAKVQYSVWAPKEPSVFGVNGAVSRKFNYQWVAHTGSVDGCFCFVNKETRAN